MAKLAAHLKSLPSHSISFSVVKQFTINTLGLFFLGKSTYCLGKKLEGADT